MNDKEKLRVLRHYLEEIYKDSREYMDDFIGASELEYVRIYDYALLELSRRLLKKLDVEI